MIKKSVKVFNNVLTWIFISIYILVIDFFLLCGTVGDDEVLFGIGMAMIIVPMIILLFIGD